MNVSYNYWKNLFFFCLGLAIGSSLCMKWMEADFWVGNEKFTVMGLELFYSREKVTAILRGLDPQVKRILVYHLYFDFVFMAGVFPAAAALCIMAGQKLISRWGRRFLLTLATLQLLAWGCDFIENCLLLNWIYNLVITDDFYYFHLLVITKFVIILAGLSISIIIIAIRYRKKSPGHLMDNSVNLS
jgi:hypothetical protein